MNKLTLELDALRVESFEIASSANPRGTVQGHDATQQVDSCGCVLPGVEQSDACSGAHTCFGTAGPGCPTNPLTSIDCG